MTPVIRKKYDQGYFEKWYRDPQHAVTSAAALRRKAALAVATAEYYLGRDVRNVLDIGCGEAVWRKPLRELRPQIDYLGLDSSDYVVARFGRTRNIRHATFGQLGELRFDSEFDLIVCSDVLHYVPSSELRVGLRGVAEMLAGVAFLELFTSSDEPEGDRHGFHHRTANWYLTTFAEAGLIACGSHCYLPQRMQESIAALEVPALF